MSTDGWEFQIVTCLEHAIPKRAAKIKQTNKHYPYRLFYAWNKLTVVIINLICLLTTITFDSIYNILIG